MQNSSMNIIATTSVTAILLGAGYWYYSKSNTKSGDMIEMPSEEVLKILSRFKRDYYPVLKMLWTTVDKVINSYKVRYGHVPESLKKNMKTIVMDENPQFHKLIQDMEDEVYSLFSIDNRKGFENLCLVLEKSHPEIKKVMEEIKENLDKACLGVSMNMEISLPDYVTKERSFDIYRSTAYSVQKSLKDFLIKYQKEHGSINPYDQEFNKQISECLSPIQIKRGLLRLNNYHVNDEFHEEYLFSASIKQFSKLEKNFEDAVKRIDTLNQQLIEMQLRPMANFDYIQTEIEKLMMIEIEQPIIQEISKDEEQKEEPKPTEDVKDIDQLEDNKQDNDISQPPVQKKEEEVVPVKQEEQTPAPVEEVNPALVKEEETPTPVKEVSPALVKEEEQPPTPVEEVSPVLVKEEETPTPVKEVSPALVKEEETPTPVEEEETPAPVEDKKDIPSEVQEEIVATKED